MIRDPREATPVEDYLNSDGHEVPNPAVVAPPVGFIKQPSMVEHLREMVKGELLRREVEAAGAETFAEADDFNIEDDPIDPSSPFEAVFDPPPTAEPERAPSGGAPVAVPPVSPSGAVPVPSAAPAPLAAPSSPVAGTPT